MSHSQNNILYISIQYINIINDILQLKILYYFEKYVKSLQHTVNSKPPVSSASVLPSVALLSTALFLYRC
jgi:hypothetical protein